MKRRTFLFSPAATLAARSLAGAGSPQSDILGAALSDQQGWRRLEHLCYHIGPRLGGSKALSQAVEWAAQLLRDDGQENVQLQPVKVPHWVRGEERCVEVLPAGRELRILGLGGSVGTPSGGVEADLVAVSDFDELERLPRSAVEGRIVLYNAPFVSYGETVTYRSSGASRAAKLGAVAALVRSVTPYSLSTPHTGTLYYAAGEPQIPAVAVTVESAERLAALYRDGVRVRIHLDMGARTLPDADSFNVLGEIRGRELPDEIVVFGGHIDSWDVGQGAHDDGAACVAALQALRLIRRLGLRPRRTLRLALWTNEENGSRGARTYSEALGDNVTRHVAAIEMDDGCERPSGFGLTLAGSDDAATIRALAQARQIAASLDGIEAGEITPGGGGGTDIAPLMRAGIPGFTLRTEGDRYLEWHHTDADTLDKVAPHNFRRAVAALGVFCYGLAEMPHRLGAER
ncbi:MAG: M20/M25/M40 family metallo-hydrolase [Bryobacteraceae bacterium]